MLDDNYQFINFMNLEKTRKIIKKRNEVVNKDKFTIIDNVNYNELYITSDLLKNIPSERYIPLNSSIFMEKIENSFLNDNDIFSQFKNDLNRSRFIINNYHITDAELIKDYLEFTYDKYIVNKILMMTTQASLGMPFELIQNSINGKYFSEISPFDKVSKVFSIYLDTSNDTIRFNINKNMRIFELIDCEAQTLCIVNIDLDYDLLNDDFIMMKLKIKKAYNYTK